MKSLFSPSRTARLFSCALVVAVTIILPGLQAADAPTGNAAHLKRSEETPDQPWRHLFGQNNIDLKESESYMLTFWAKASQSMKLKVSTKVGQPPWAYFGLRTEVELSPEWQRYELTFDGKGSVPEKTRLSFNYGGTEPGDIWIADARLRVAGTDENSTENLLKNPRFDEDLQDWYTEGVQPGIFLVETQPVSDAK